MTVDFRKVLIGYINDVLSNEGVTFIDPPTREGLRTARFGLDLDTLAEQEALLLAAAEARIRDGYRRELLDGAAAIREQIDALDRTAA